MRTTNTTGATVDPCGVVTGSVTAVQAVAPFDPLTERSRATWTSGDFTQVALGYSAGAAAFVERLSLTPGENVLDVACGGGNLALPAAARGARVTGIDIAPNLVDAARAASAAAALDIRFDVGNAEALPYEDGAFDTVISMFGVMFAARPERALSELVRVTRPAGRIVLANWTPHGFIGSMLRAHLAMVPPPVGSPSALAWGDEETMRHRVEPHASRVKEIRFIGRMIQFVYPLTPGGVVELFRQCYGPTVRAFGALDAQGRAQLAAELLRLWSGRNHGPDGSTHADAEYLEVQIEIA
jgi:SAM-dependent methyltransferase